MAEEKKTQFKPVDVSFDAEGNPVVKQVEIPEPEEQEDQQEESQEEETQEQEEQQDTDDDAEGSEDDRPDGEESGEDSQEEGDDESDDQEESSEEEVEEEDDFEEEGEEETEADQEDDVVDYNELPESIQKALDFMEETGGSLADFLEINQDFSKLPQDDVIGRYLKSQYPTLDAEDIAYEIESRFGTDEDDDERTVRRKAVEKKKFYAQALKFLESGAEKFRTELGSSAGLSAKAQEAIKFQEQYQSQQAQSTKKLEAARSSFIKGTNKLFGKDFKGFGIKVGEETHLYKPENVTKLKEQNLDVNNLLGKYLDKDGNVTDVEGYHKMMAVASNPEAYAQHFFELGKAAMAEEDAKDSKNITSGKKTRGTKPNPKQPNAPKFKFLDDNSVPKGKIRLKSY